MTKVRQLTLFQDELINVESLVNENNQLKLHNDQLEMDVISLLQLLLESNNELPVELATRYMSIDWSKFNNLPF